MNHLNIKRTILSSTIAAILSTLYAGTALAQGNSDAAEEILITEKLSCAPKN